MDPQDVVLATNTELQRELRLFDEAELEVRAERIREVNELLLKWSADGFLHTAGIEATWILSEAKDAYIYGLFIASLFSSHSACERRLAGALDMVSGGHPPKGSHMWGLGRLNRWAQGVGLAEDLSARLEELAATRRRLAHFKKLQSDDPSWVADILMNPTSIQGDWQDEAMGALRRNALQALDTAYSLYFRLSGFP